MEGEALVPPSADQIAAVEAVLEESNTLLGALSQTMLAEGVTAGAEFQLLQECVLERLVGLP